MEIFVDVIVADGSYVACEHPLPTGVGVGKIVPVACRHALGLGRAVEDRMAVYHVEERRFLEWPGFTETAVRDLDTLVVVASPDPVYESGKTLEALWTAAAGLGRRARGEGTRRGGDAWPPSQGAARQINRNVVRSSPRASKSVEHATPAGGARLGGARGNRPNRNGLTATDLALAVVLDELAEEKSDSESIRARGSSATIQSRPVAKRGHLNDTAAYGAIAAAGDEAGDDLEIPGSGAPGWSAAAAALSAVESRDSLRDTEVNDAIDDSDGLDFLASPGDLDPLDDTLFGAGSGEFQQGSTTEELESPADVFRRASRAATFIDALAVARAETELAPSGVRPVPARGKPRTRPPKPPPGRRSRRKSAGSRAPTHL